MWTFQSRFMDVDKPWQDKNGKPVKFINGLYSTDDEGIAEKCRKDPELLEISKIIAEAKDEMEAEKIVKEKGRPPIRRGVKTISGMKTSTVSIDEKEKQ